MPDKGLIIPGWLKKGAGSLSSPVYFFDFSEHGIDVETDRGLRETDAAVGKILKRVSPRWEPEPPALIKIHPGEPKSKTHLIPGLMSSQAAFSRAAGVEPVLGDSTVLYTGNRGYQSNPSGNASRYMTVVEKNRWDKARTGLDFVVIDRPSSSVPGVFEFNDEEILKEVDSPGCFNRVYVSGGFEAAGAVLNNVHLTLHGMSPLALSVKGLTMGCAGVSGKKQMHMNLHPKIDPEACRKCGLCVKNCPFEALLESDEGVPTLVGEKCVGCGECMAVCPGEAIVMHHSGGITWGIGKGSFLSRLSDFLVSMMNEKWDGLLNIGHLYRITEQCDCMDIVQKPIVGDIGMIVSRNPFAADRLAMELLLERGRREGREIRLGDYSESFEYVEEKYGIITKPEMIRV